MGSNITTIIPIHSIEGDTMEWFSKAIKSIENQIVRPDEVFIVRCKCKDVKSKVDTYDYGSIKDIVKIIENDSGDKDFCSQINFGVNEVKTDYFSFLEIDDEYSSIWIKNAVEYIKAYNDVSLFLPIIVDTDVNGHFIDFTNNPVWAKEFSDEMGYLDNSTLFNYPNFNIDGMVMKVDVFKKLGGLKKSVKLTFIYEFLLRMTYNDIKVMVIPKLGYKHTNQRPGSLFGDYTNNVSQDESRFWMNTAKKEYFFTADREIEYDAIT